MENKYVCIHGHFYQPPRENPWLNEVEIQDSAYPYHDWNERITAECYARNSASRILDGEGRIVDIVNNYSKISFNFGPTLLSWMKEKSPDIYEKILEADKISQENFSGHGSAMAQAYNHMIMPLANEHDKETQVIWGIKDFESRFNRKPEGMWCGETAMNVDTLEVMARHGIIFTVLSPYQAKQVRPLNGEDTEWENVEGANVDPRVPYLCKLPSGNTINIFFYDGPVSQGIAFEGLLNSGETFADRLMQAFVDEDRPQLVNIATDGETYGHHHDYGEMALSYCLHHLESENLARITNYGEYLEMFPPEFEVEIIDNSSWSCYHGVERWKSNCGCSTGMNGGWHQEWRAPLRESFDWLRDELIPRYEKAMKKYKVDPWEIRNAYIEVVLDRSFDNTEQFFKTYFPQKLPYEEKVNVLKLLEMQHHAMLMYTSCGWFFDEVTGIESMQDVAYAGRTIQLAEELFDIQLEDAYIKKLEQAPSNIPKFQNAGNAYNMFVKPAKIDMNRVGAHYAVASLFTDQQDEQDIYSFKAISEEYNLHKTGRYRIAIGTARIISRFTLEQKDISFAIMHLGEHNIFGGVREFTGNQAFEQMHQEIREVFEKYNVHEVVALMDKHFGMHNYSFWHLFKEAQQRIMDYLMKNTLKTVDSTFRQVFDLNYPLLQALNDLNIHIPKPLKISSEYVLNNMLYKELKKHKSDHDKLRELIDEVEQLSVEPDYITLNFTASNKINNLMDELYEDYQNEALMLDVIDFIDITHKLNLRLDFWQAQNKAFWIRKAFYPEYQKKSKQQEDAQNWCELFDKLYERLNLKK